MAFDAPWRRPRRADHVTQLAFLTDIIRRLDDASIPHMLAGSMASTFHGEPRMTRDVDLVIDPTLASMREFVAGLDRSRYYVDDAEGAVRHRGMCNVIDTETGWKADLIVRKLRPFSETEFGRRQLVEISGIELFVASAEDTVLAKLEWRSASNSEQQLRDVVAVLAAQPVDLVYLRHWATELGVAEALCAALEAAGRN